MSIPPRDFLYLPHLCLNSALTLAEEPAGIAWLLGWEVWSQRGAMRLQALALRPAIRSLATEDRSARGVATRRDRKTLSAPRSRLGNDSVAAKHEAHPCLRIDSQTVPPIPGRSHSACH